MFGMSKPAYLIFDVEAVADGQLISRVKYPDETISPEAAIAQFRAEQAAQSPTGSDFIPYTYMLPISIAIAKVSADYQLLDLTVLDSPQFRSHVMTAHFWQGWRHYNHPTLVTFNGRGFDIPLLELAAYRYGISLPDWFNVDAKTYDQARNRYNTHSHLDLMDLLSNFGASRMNGGLNVLANLIGKPGKTGIDGSMVQDLYHQGQVQKINDYCLADVLDTYFVFLRTRVLLGRLTLEQEHTLVEHAKLLLSARQKENPAFAHYLSHWGDWNPPG
jgi:predicted PolB exonuclease-like 3'-5' exonuclease